MTRVSVITPSFNTARAHLDRCIKSVLGQTFSDIEHIIVDDGSPSGEAEEAAQAYPKVRYIRLDRNYGRSHARNIGIRAASGEFVAFLDADDWWLPMLMERQMRIFSERPEVGLLSSDSFVMLPSGHRSSKLFSEFYNPLHKFRPPEGDVIPIMIIYNAIRTSTVTVRKSLLDSVGLFNEELPCGEDWELWLRLARHGKFGYIPEPLCYYSLNQNAGSWQADAKVRIPALTLILDRAFKEENLLARFGADKVGRLRRLSYGQMWFDMGTAQLIRRKAHEARKSFLNSIRINPRPLKAYAFLALSCLPNCLIQALFDWRSRR